MPLDNCTHSFRLSKTYADLLVQEFKNNFTKNSLSEQDV